MLENTDCWNLYFHLFKQGITTWQEVQAISAEYDKDQWKCMVHFEDKGMFPKVHWWILEGSGRFLASLGLKGQYRHDQQGMESESYF